jgi:tartrate-resistant acid phosphatase type 5
LLRCRCSQIGWIVIVAVGLILNVLVLTGCGALPEGSNRGQKDVRAESIPSSTPFTPPTMPPTASVAPPTPSPSPTATPRPSPTATPVPPTRVAVIGDYGVAGPAEERVAALVKSWNPDFVLTLGDNNYPSGAATTIDQNIGQYYHDFIFPYQGQYGEGSATNRFFPVLGNHDWETAAGTPYFDYFTLPGNERYYAFSWGPLRLFALSSTPLEPDGVSSDSVQAMWLQQELTESTACWDIVYMHHPPFSSGMHGSSIWMQWPYESWGADAVLAGHDHLYERIMRDGLPYFVNGLGGASSYEFGESVVGSEARYNADNGAMLIEVTPDQITFQFITHTGEIIDTYRQSKDCASGGR